MLKPQVYLFYLFQDKSGTINACLCCCRIGIVYICEDNASMTKYLTTYTTVMFTPEDGIKR